MNFAGASAASKQMVHAGRGGVAGVPRGAGHVRAARRALRRRRPPLRRAHAGAKACIYMYIHMCIYT